MKEAKAKSNLFTILLFDIKCFIDTHSIKCNALNRVDVLVDGRPMPLNYLLETHKRTQPLAQPRLVIRHLTAPLVLLVSLHLLTQY
jgi:hypothetical protein